MSGPTIPAALFACLLLAGPAHAQFGNDFFSGNALSNHTGPTDRLLQDTEALRERATRMARNALGRRPDRLDDTEQQVSSYQPTAAAAGAQADADAAFARKDWPAALAHYRRAMAADPAFAGAALGAGRCHFALGQWDEAETLFRQAIAIDARQAAPWSFLADTYVAQGKLDDAVAALEAGIAAYPAYRPNWQRLSYLQVSRGRPPLARLDMQPLVRLTEYDGKPAAAVNFTTSSRAPAGADLAIALAQANTAIELARIQPPLSPFQVELQGWRSAFELADELANQPAGQRLNYPPMLTLQRLHRANALDAAILLLRFREAYRPDLEAWLASRPHAVREFAAIWALQP